MLPLQNNITIIAINPTIQLLPIIQLISVKINCNDFKYCNYFLACNKLLQFFYYSDLEMIISSKHIAIKRGVPNVAINFFKSLPISKDIFSRWWKGWNRSGWNPLFLKKVTGKIWLANSGLISSWIVWHGWGNQRDFRPKTFWWIRFKMGSPWGSLVLFKKHRTQIKPEKSLTLGGPHQGWNLERVLKIKNTERSIFSEYKAFWRIRVVPLFLPRDHWEANVHTSVSYFVQNSSPHCCTGESTTWSYPSLALLPLIWHLAQKCCCSSMTK